LYSSSGHKTKRLHLSGTNCLNTKKNLALLSKL
jgi:hypothetical protein